MNRKEKKSAKQIVPKGFYKRMRENWILLELFAFIHVIHNSPKTVL